MWPACSWNMSGPCVGFDTHTLMKTNTETQGTHEDGCNTDMHYFVLSVFGWYKVYCHIMWLETYDQ